MDALTWVVATLLIGLAALRAWGAIASYRRLHRVPSGRRRTALFIVVAAVATCVAGILLALAILLSTFREDGEWKVPLLIALGASILAAIPGLASYLWHHHEPWLFEWRTDDRPGIRPEARGRPETKP